MGPVSIGYQTFYVDSGLTGAASTTTTAKTVGTSSGQFDGDNMSIAFNVNDDLSISYAEAEETFDDRTSSTTTDVTQNLSHYRLLTQWVQCQSRHTQLR